MAINNQYHVHISGITYITYYLNLPYKNRIATAFIHQYGWKNTWLPLENVLLFNELILLLSQSQCFHSKKKYGKLIVTHSFDSRMSMHLFFSFKNRFSLTFWLVSSFLFSREYVHCTYPSSSEFISQGSGRRYMWCVSAHSHSFDDGFTIVTNLLHIVMYFPQFL